MLGPGRVTMGPGRVVTRVGTMTGPVGRLPLVGRIAVGSITVGRGLVGRPPVGRPLVGRPLVGKPLVGRYGSSGGGKVREVGTEGAGRVTIEVATVPVSTGKVSTVDATTDGREVTVSTGMGIGASPVETATVGVGTTIDVPWAEVGAGAAADDDAGF